MILGTLKRFDLITYNGTPGIVVRPPNETGYLRLALVGFADPVLVHGRDQHLNLLERETNG